MKTLFTNCTCEGVKRDIAIENGRIADLPTGDDVKVIDLHGLRLYPGLVDIHTHGCVGADTMDADADALGKMSTFLLEHGTTSWLPTTMTESIESIRAAVLTSLPEDGAEILGFHAEGPYINPTKKGAQNEAYIKSPEMSDFCGLFGEKGIKMITLAPEMNGSMKYIKDCPAVISVGHTDADYECTTEACLAGAKCLTHTFNAMPPILHRAPGPIGAAIDNDMYAQVICDGLHIQKSVIKMLYRTFGKERMVLISDSMRATGLCDGEYMFGGQPIMVRDGVARVVSDGALAGSTSTLFDCVKKAIEFGIPETDAFYMATRTPCALMGFEGKGRLDIGADADIIGIDDKLNIALIIKGGQIVKYKQI